MARGRKPTKKATAVSTSPKTPIELPSRSTLVPSQVSSQFFISTCTRLALFAILRLGLYPAHSFPQVPALSCFLFGRRRRTPRIRILYDLTPHLTSVTSRQSCLRSTGKTITDHALFQDMTPAMPTGNSATNSANRQIPLVCSVCPDVPRFSDVSHLLTHIASKGHLHHETQTKLKAHQDIAASVALRRYEE